MVRSMGEDCNALCEKDGRGGPTVGGAILKRPAGTSEREAEPDPGAPPADGYGTRKDP